jgi:PPOX class probable F420-dependent enzyme
LDPIERKGASVLKDSVKELATGRNFAAFTSLFRDGTPQTHPMWVDADDEHVMVNTETGRQKYRNIKRDPRATIMIWDQDGPYRYAEVRGEVVEIITGAEARAHIDKLSQKMTGQPYGFPIQTERVILKIKPHRQQP